jgi:uncharacterized protein YdbL (DUF1318 family)
LLITLLICSRNGYALDLQTANAQGLMVGTPTAYLYSLFFSSREEPVLDLKTAKAQGLIEETPTGYLALLLPGHDEAAELVESINDKRKQRYQEIARRSNAPLHTVELLAGKSALEKSQAGHSVLVAGIRGGKQEAKRAD